MNVISNFFKNITLNTNRILFNTLIAVAITFLISACNINFGSFIHAKEANEAWEKHIDQLHYKSYKEILACAGPPSQSYEVSDNKVIYSYDLRTSLSYCKADLTIENGIVTDVESEHDNPAGGMNGSYVCTQTFGRCFNDWNSFKHVLEPFRERITR
jgi:hypothetical protein